MSLIISWKRAFSLLALISLFMPMATLPSSGDQTTSGTKAFSDDMGGPAPMGPWDQPTWTRYRDMDDTLNELKVLSSSFSSIMTMYNLSAMFPFGNGNPRYTYEGRTIWAVKISDEPGINDSNEPEAFMCALTHAREWITNEVMMYFINYLLRNYAWNSTISSLVNTTELWIIPIVNPDGFQESIDNDDFNNSYGVYGWRKNKNETNGVAGFQNYGSAQGDGVDLNRNFNYQWSGSGSSTNPEAVTYRGAMPLSEPETQIIHELAKSRDFSIALSYHSYSGLNLYPWGHTSTPPKDAQLLQEIADRMTEINGYVPIQSYNLYQTNGDFNDYFYGTWGIPAFTPEVNDRDVKFIPEIDKISVDCKSNLEVSFLIASLAHDPYAAFQAGIDGKVRDPTGTNISDANINIIGRGRNINLSSDANGSFRANLQPGTYTINITTPGGLTNRTTTTVLMENYRKVTYIVIERVPPVVDSVKAYLGGLEVTSAEWGDVLKVIVTERYSEANLTGIVSIRADDGTTGASDVPLSMNGTIYEALWDTRLFDAEKTYELEGVLIDRYGNSDRNGSDPSGPDLTVDVTDTEPPQVYFINVTGTKNELGSFEWGADLTFEAWIEGGRSYERDLDCTLTVMNGSDTMSVHAMDWFPITDLYKVKVPSKDIGMGDFTFRVTATDAFGNSITSGEAMFGIRDTTAPVFTLMIANSQTGAFRDGTVIDFLIRPNPMEDGLRPEVMVFDPDLELVASLNGTYFDEATKSFLLQWDSKGAGTGNYRAEGRLYDASGNFLPDGALSSYDVSFPMIDLTPPGIRSVLVNGKEVPELTTIETMESFDISVLPSAWEPGSSCRLEKVFADTNPNGPFPLAAVDNASFGARIDSTVMGYGTFDLEVVLEDRFGNADPQGLYEGTDITVTISRSPLEIRRSQAHNLDHEEHWSTNVTEWVLAGEDVQVFCSVSNWTTFYTRQLIIDGKVSDLVIIYEGEEVDGIWNTNMWTTLDTTYMKGSHTFFWRFTPGTGPVMETAPFIFNVVEHGEGPVRSMTVTGWYPIGRTEVMVNLSWSPPLGADSLRLEVSYLDNATNISLGQDGTFPPDRTTASLRLPRANLSFLMVAVFQLFPENADRTFTTESFIRTEGSSLTSFHPPPLPAVPEDDDEESNDNTMVIIIAAALLCLLFMIIVLIAFLLARKKKREGEADMVWSME